jgi:hypothetical protein
MQYNFTTIWIINTQIEPIWQAINDVLQWPKWWQGVASVQQLEAGNNGLGQVNLLTWKSVLPYKLKFTATVSQLVKHELIIANATGELEGSGQWIFERLSANSTKLTYIWQVRTTKKWMNLLAPLAFIFRYNHNVVMKWGVMV